MAATEASILPSICNDSEQESEYASSECDHLDLLDDPEELWNTYLRGVRFHGYDHCSKNKSKTIKQKKSLATNPKRVDISQHEEPVTQVNDDLTGKEDKIEASETTQGARTADPSVAISGKNTVGLDRPADIQPDSYWNYKKKMRMRPANEVISRILWDAELPAENFVVGYLDRFSGLMEKPFQFFSWEDLASVDYDVLAVPKHRIVYFKYRGQKIWDKNERLDLVFGSTESSKESDIRELVQQIDLEYEKKKLALTYDSDSDDESDDVHVTIHNVRQPDADTYLPKSRPNYFVAVRVTDPQVIAEASKIKKHIVAKDGRLYDFLMPDEVLHISLAMLKLDNTAEIATAAHAIESCRESMANFFTNPIPVQLEGLATFNGYVLYVPVIAPPAFYELHKSLLNHLKASEVPLAHEYDFVPHVTLLKLTKSRAKVLKCPYIDPYVYVDVKHTSFGIQTCNNLQLCVIGEQKRWDGFYNCAAEVYFT